MLSLALHLGCYKLTILHSLPVLINQRLLLSLHSFPLSHILQRLFGKGAKSTTSSGHILLIISQSIHLVVK